MSEDIKTITIGELIKELKELADKHGDDAILIDRSDRKHNTMIISKQTCFYHSGSFLMYKKKD